MDTNILNIKLVSVTCINLFQSNSVPVHCCPASRKWTPEPTLNKKSQDCSVVFYLVKKQATRHISNSRFYCESIEQTQTLCNVVQEAPDNIAQEKKILINVVLIPLGQYSTGKNLMQFCPRDSSQHSTRKILISVFLILLGQHCRHK